MTAETVCEETTIYRLRASTRAARRRAAADHRHGLRLGGILLAAAIGLAPVRALAQAPSAQSPQVRGVVLDVQGGVLPGVAIGLTDSDTDRARVATTDLRGEFALDVSPGSYRLTAELAGFAAHREDLTIGASGRELIIRMRLASFTQEVVVSATIPDMAREQRIDARELEDRAAQDVAEHLRTEPGIFSIRRGPINMEPTIRGLQETQIAMLVDGTRTFAAGPARMDSDISHVSPRTIESVRVVKGPYALAWGAGALSAIQLETFKPAFTVGAFEADGRLGFNYGENGDTSNAFASVWGSNDRMRFALFHDTRVGNDYRDGNDDLVPGDYESFDTKWAAGWRASPRLVLDYSGGYQKQNDIDHPGRLLDATFFETYSHSVEATWQPAGAGALQEVHGQLYVNVKDHRMNNNDKPTARDAPGRVPPFGIRVDLPTESDTIGGRGHVLLDQGALTWRLGFDFYRLRQEAERTISRRSDDLLLFRDIVWPDARLSDIGAYAQLIHQRGRGQVGGTIRIDRFEASANDVSAFFLSNTTGALDQEDTNVSAAFSGAFQVTDLWSLTAGIGRSVRSATTLERYSDRFPSTRFQIAAEFMGSPDLKPEASLELDVGTAVGSRRASLEVDYFYRTIDDYITVMADPTLARRLPLSPPAVFRYVNGTSARFTGYELRGQSEAGDYVDVSGAVSYTWAEDDLFDEPAFGIAPILGRLAVRLHPAAQPHWVELAVTSAGAQDRVAAARLEVPTAGWTTVDLRAAVALGPDLTLRIGVENLGNRAYATHLNTLNPFTGARILERGRSFYVGLGYGS